MSVRVSFILPTRNRPKFFEKTLISAAKFVGKHDEFIVVDASRGSETKIIASHFPFVTKYIHVEDRGEAFSFNTGLIEATGKFIKEVPDDDIIFPEKFKKAISFMEKHPDVDAIQCGGEAYKLLDDGTMEHLGDEKLPRNRRITHDFNAVMQYVPCGLGLVFRRSILPKVGLFDTSYTAVDTNYLARIILAGCNLKYLDICLYRHILYPHSAENRDEQIHADRSRSYLILSMWSQALSLKTAYVAKSLGIGSKHSDRGYLWVVKLLNYFRLTTPGMWFFSISGTFIEFGRGFFLISKRTENQKFTSAKWTEKSW